MSKPPDANDPDVIAIGTGLRIYLEALGLSIDDINATVDILPKPSAMREWALHLSESIEVKDGTDHNAAACVAVVIPILDALGIVLAHLIVRHPELVDDKGERLLAGMLALLRPIVDRNTRWLSAAPGHVAPAPPPSGTPTPLDEDVDGHTVH
jgi:hypothetical protein